MFVWNWFKGILNYLGLYNKSGKMLFLGLDNAGKTTLLHMLKSDKLGQYPSTGHPNVEDLTMGNLTFKTIDLGGHELARRLWKDYFTSDVTAIVFIVDAADQSRFGEAKKVLDSLLTDEALNKLPFLIFGNKIDMQGAVSEIQLKTALGLDGYTTGKSAQTPGDVRPLEVFMCSIVKGMGYGDGFRWLSNYV